MNPYPSQNQTGLFSRRAFTFQFLFSVRLNQSRSPGHVLSDTAGAA